MHQHHAATIANVIAHFSPDPDVLALLLSGSIARTLFFHPVHSPRSSLSIKSQPKKQNKN